MYRSYIDQTLSYFDRPHVGVPDGPVDDHSRWRADELDESVWTRSLTDEEQAWFARVGQAQVAGGQPLAELTMSDLDGSGVSELTGHCRNELDRGRGFVLLRSLPIEQMTTAEIEAAFWAFGLLLGAPGAQNGQGDLLGHVRDYQDEADVPVIREYRTTVDINFHCDAADVVGLLCLAEARSGGASRIVSSVEVFNVLVAEHPELAARLCEEVQLDTRSDGEGFAHVPVRPSCFDGSRLRTFMHLGYFRSAARHPDVEIDDRLADALDAWEAIADTPERCLDMELRRGDIQLCSNHTVAHARRAYVDDPAAPRHLLRLWLTL